MGPWHWFIHFNRLNSPVVSKIRQLSTTRLWHGFSDMVFWYGRSDRSLWQGHSDRLIWHGCSDTSLWHSLSDILLWHGRTHRLLWQGCSDRLLWQVALTGLSDRLFRQGHPTLTNPWANFVSPTLTIYSTSDRETLVVTNPGGATTQILYMCKSAHLVYTTSSTAVLCELWQTSHTTLSLNDSQSLTAILSISLSKFCL